MILKDFIAYYKQSKNKEEFLKKHILNKYVNYQDKIAECKEIFKRTSYIKDSDIYSVDSPARYMLFMYRLIVLYIDIEIDSNLVLDSFNEINKQSYIINDTDVGLMTAITMNISQREMTEFSNILHMVEDDFEINNRSIYSYLENKSKGIDSLLEGFLSSIEEGSPNGN